MAEKMESTFKKCQWVIFDVCKCCHHVEWVRGCWSDCEAKVSMVMHSHEVKEGIGFGLEALTYHLIDAPNLRCKQTIYYAFTLLRIFFFLYIYLVLAFFLLLSFVIWFSCYRTGNDRCQWWISMCTSSVWLHKLRTTYDASKRKRVHKCAAHNIRDRHEGKSRIESKLVFALTKLFSFFMPIKWRVWSRFGRCDIGWCVWVFARAWVHLDILHFLKSSSTAAIKNCGRLPNALCGYLDRMCIRI